MASYEIPNLNFASPMQGMTPVTGQNHKNTFVFSATVTKPDGSSLGRNWRVGFKTSPISTHRKLKSRINKDESVNFTVVIHHPPVPVATPVTINVKTCWVDSQGNETDFTYDWNLADIVPPGRRRARPPRGRPVPLTQPPPAALRRRGWRGHDPRPPRPPAGGDDGGAAGPARPSAGRRPAGGRPGGRPGPSRRGPIARIRNLVSGGPSDLTLEEFEALINKVQPAHKFEWTNENWIDYLEKILIKPKTELHAHEFKTLHHNCLKLYQDLNERSKGSFNTDLFTRSWVEGGRFYGDIDEYKKMKGTIVEVLHNLARDSNPRGMDLVLRRDGRKITGINKELMVGHLNKIDSNGELEERMDHFWHEVNNFLDWAKYIVLRLKEEMRSGESGEGSRPSVRTSGRSDGGPSSRSPSGSPPSGRPPPAEPAPAGGRLTEIEEPYDEEEAEFSWEGRQAKDYLGEYPNEEERMEEHGHVGTLGGKPGDES